VDKVEFAVIQNQGQNSQAVLEDSSERRVSMQTEKLNKKMLSPVCQLKIGGWYAPEDEIPKGGWRAI
jgi:hypothetical protein